MNTDMVAVRHLLGDRRFERVLLLGAGGAARGAIEAIASQVGSVIVSDRHPEAASELASRTSAREDRPKPVEWGTVDTYAPMADLVINATPIGKHEDTPPWGKCDLARDCVVYDFVYASLTTSSIQYAEQHGLRYIDGWAYLWAQAAAMTGPLGLPETTPGLLWDSCVSLRGSTGTHGPFSKPQSKTGPGVDNAGGLGSGE